MTALRRRIGLAQIGGGLAGIEASLAKHLEHIAAARDRGCDVLLFPELSLVPYACGPRVLDLALDRKSDVVGRLAEASAGMTTVFGFVEEGIAAQYYNTAAAVRDGELLFLHRKINLPMYGRLEEGKHFASGRFVETFEIGAPWRASVLICADMWNPALVHLVAVHGTTLLLGPISSAAEAVGVEFDNPQGWDLAARFYAKIYGMPVAICNRVGVEDGMTFWGGSCLIDPFGNIVEQAADDEDALIVGTMDFEQVRRARYQLPTLRDSNLALIRHEINRLAELVGVPAESRKL